LKLESRLTSHKLFQPCLWLACLALADGLMLTPEGSLPRVAAALALLLLPGLAWTELLFPAGRLLRWSIGAGLGYALAMLAGLILHYLPGPISLWQELVALNALVLLPLLLRIATPRRPDAPVVPVDNERLIHIALLLAVLLLAGLFRFAYLGYSEFQGDEIKALTPAARALQGQPDALFEDRKKGPGEILLPMMVWGMTGTLDETTARLPFAVAGLAMVLTTYLIGRKMAGERAGLLAALLLALNGFFVAFSRIVQYQSVVAWMSALAILCAWQWRASLQTRWAMLSGIFLGAGLLGHYDALVVVPVIAYVGLAAIFGRSPSASQRLGHTAVSVLAALGCLLLVAGLFYLPYVFNPQITETTGYVAGRVGALLQVNQLSFFVSHSTFYTSFYYLAVTGLLVLGFLAWAIGRIPLVRRLPGGRYAVPLLAASAALSLMIWPDMARLPGLDLSVVVFALILLVAFLSPVLTPAQRDAVVWLACSFLGFVFVVYNPLTHIHSIYPAWVLLGGMAAARLLELAGDGRRRLLFYAGSLFLVLAFGGYDYIAYLRQDVEFWEDWPDSRVAFFWAPSPYDQVPGVDIFGFVHRSGWKGIGALYDAGQLLGDFNSNEKPAVTAWYTRGDVRATPEEAAACDFQPEYYFVADDLVESLNQWPVSSDDISARYDAVGRIEAPNGKGLTIYQIRPSTGNLGRIEVDSLARAFDRTATPARFLQSQPPSQPVDVNLHGAIRLIGYDIDLRRAAPGGRIAVTLYWKALVDIPLELHVFAQLESASGDPPGVWGQSNGTPACGRSPTRGWKAGHVVADRRVLIVRSDTPPGDYVILAGMYLPENGTRLDVRDGDGNPIGDAVRLTTLSIRR
jgi:Dolichyl-phosphate-mannose-protein mannosyltransferase